MGPYTQIIKQLEEEIQDKFAKVNLLKGVKESDTGLSNQALWDTHSDRHLLTSEQSLQVLRKEI